MTYSVWMAVPGARGWSCIARDLTAEQVEVYRETLLHQANIEESKKEE